MSIIVAILVFSIIIIIHELGHFLLAKKNGSEKKPTAQQTANAEIQKAILREWKLANATQLQTSSKKSLLVPNSQTRE